MGRKDKYRVYCNSCKKYTNHILLFSHSKHDQYDELFVDCTYNLFACAGCDSVTLEEVEEVDGLNAFEPERCTYYYPKRNEESKEKKVFYKMPQSLCNIYDEIIDAYNEELDVLCAAGLRSLVEGICAESGIQGQDLPEKINALEATLPEHIIDVFHELRFMGNNAIHRLTPPERSDLKLAIDIVEAILHFLYELDDTSKKLLKARRRVNFEF